jgi:YVTN family beta-propeller protein
MGHGPLCERIVPNLIPPSDTNPVVIAVHPIHSKVFVADSTKDSVSVLDGSKANLGNAVVYSIRVGMDPRAIAIDPILSKVYVANYGNHTISVIDTKPTRPSQYKVVETISARRIDKLVVHPLTLNIYAFEKGSRIVHVIYVPSYRIVPITLPDTVDELVIHPLRHWVYCLHKGDKGAIYVLNGLCNQLFATLPVGKQPSAMAVHPKYLNIYVANSGDNTVSILHGFTHKVLATVPVGGMPREIVMGDTNVYIANQADSSISVLHGTVVTKTFPLHSQHFALAIDPKCNALYVANADENTVSVIDETHHAVVAVLPVGNKPTSIVVHPTSSMVYVGNDGDGTVTVIDGEQRKVQHNVAHTIVGKQHYRCARSSCDYIAHSTLYESTQYHCCAMCKKDGRHGSTCERTLHSNASTTQPFVNIVL